MIKKNLYRPGVKFRYNRAKGYSEPVGGWDGAVIGYEVEFVRGAYVRCYIRPTLGIKDIWEAREYAKLYAICESLRTARTVRPVREGRRLILTRPPICNRLQKGDEESAEIQHSGNSG